jgi:NAD(P)-dependent dehydrogenase (short-subunit alcohol dehydrogenase family)
VTWHSRLFARAGYSIALIARSKTSLKSLADDIKLANQARPTQVDYFPVDSYSPQDISVAFTNIRARFPPAEFSIRTALFNVGAHAWGPFLSMEPEQIRGAMDTGVIGAFAFAREVILQFMENDVNVDGALGGKGKRGTLIFTGATASLRGNVTTSVFAASKHAVRALSQSLAKEFGAKDIHVGACPINTNGVGVDFFRFVFRSL